MITIQTDYMTPLPCNMNDIKCFTISKKDFIFLHCNGHTITTWSICKQVIERIKLNQNYQFICYDNCENCYWALSENESNIIYQLDTCFHEIGYISISDPSQQCAISLCYDECEKGIWVCYPSEVAFIEKCSKATTWYKNDIMNIKNSAVLIQCGFRIDCSCENNRYVMKIQSSYTEECTEIAIPKEYRIIGISSCCCECSCICRFNVLLLNICTKNYVLKEYRIDFTDGTLNSDTEFPCLPDTRYGKYEIMHSIALEEAGISHILNAEGEKIQKAVAISNNIDELICVNESVKRTLTQVTLLEGMLYSKLEALVNGNDFDCDIDDPCQLSSDCECDNEVE